MCGPITSVTGQPLPVGNGQWPAFISHTVIGTCTSMQMLWKVIKGSVHENHCHGVQCHLKGMACYN